MKIKIENCNPNQKKTAMLCGFVLEGSDKVLGLTEIDSKVVSSVKQTLKDMGGKFGKISIVPTKSFAQRILLAGIGKKEKFTNDTIRYVSGKIAQKARDLKLKEFSIISPPRTTVDPISSTSQIVEGCKMSLYKFEKFKSEKDNSAPDLSIISSKVNKISKAVKTAEIVSDGSIFTKSIANLPPNECTPSTLANFARDMAKKNKMKCTIISKNELKKKGFGGITAVGQGSKNEPKMIILEHNKGRASEKPIVLVGKAVTFDTGGISLKPGEKMDEMKFDKCGGCTVLGIMKTISEMKLTKKRCWNNTICRKHARRRILPTGRYYKAVYNGKTAEILNTDAEGRLILSDAISLW